MRFLIIPIILIIVIVVLAACAGQSSPASRGAPTATPSPVPAIPAIEGMRSFVVLPEQSSASYIVEEELFAGALEKYGLAIGWSTVTGSTNQVEGILQLDVTTAEMETAEFTVHLPSLVTGQDDRDGWIRDNALESNRYPLATFVASEIRNAPANYMEGQEVDFQLAGEITIREITQPVVFDVTATLTGDTIQGVAETDLKMSDFGFEPPSFAGTLTVRDDLAVRVEFTAREQ
jgi:polyisoprenoid-binding protein YceI